jgi:predicted nucleotidyltransferase
MDDMAWVRKHRQEIISLAQKRGAHNIRVFGSMARGEAGIESDIDLLVDMDQGRTLLDIGGLLMDLRELLGRPVDIVAVDELSDPRMRDVILSEAVPL